MPSPDESEVTLEQLTSTLAQQCGATPYTPPPMRAVRGWSFTHDQLATFAAAVAAEPCAQLADWAAERWHAEVAQRPLENVHRRSLDDTWRQVLRYLGVDDRVRLGPTHDELLQQ
ncbi:hypothetical protein [Pseudacidovorax intermedius]|uniref:hypothetical protein n=1 Tax=Pseudacidovorax intermedius TaxID=433924 RepID=UPI0026EA0467|nr:hypothetical protein [Pseudacidovorax intermedius]